MSNPAIRKFLDLSTAHCPPAIRDNLAETPGIVTCPHEYGFLLWVPDDPEENAKGDVEMPPAEMLLVQLYARRHDCDYVLFDADGPENDELALYEDEEA